MAENNTLLEKLNALRPRFEEVGTLITDPNVICDQQRYVKLTKEYKDLEDLMNARQEYENLLGNLEEAMFILHNEDDAEMKEMAREEAASCEKRIPELEEEILCAETKDSVLSKDDYDLVYYGGAHGVYAVSFDYLGPTTDEYWYYDVPRGQEMNYVPISLYRDGEICSLREGLQKGWITEQEAKLFYRNYRCLHLDRNSGNQPDKKRRTGVKGPQSPQL